MCYLIWQEEIKVADAIKFPNQLTLTWGDYRDLSEKFQSNHMSPHNQKQKRESERCDMKWT